MTEITELKRINPKILPLLFEIITIIDNENYYNHQNQDLAVMDLFLNRYNKRLKE